MLKDKSSKRRGQGIVSVIVASGVGAIVLGFLTDMLVQQGISQKFLTQKLEMNDLTANLITTFSKSNNCECQFSADSDVNPNSANFTTFLKFNNAVTDGSQVINVKKIYAGCKSGGQMPLLIAEEGQPLPNASSLRVDKVEFANLRPTGGALNEWQGQWRISFQVGSNSAIRSVRPVLVSQKVTIAPAGANTRITGCSGLSTGSGTQNFLAKWSATPGVLEDSSIFESDTTGGFGVGTNNPSSTSKMEVAQSASDSILSIQAGSPGNSVPQSILRFYGEYGNRPNGAGGAGTDEGLAIRYDNAGNSFIESFVEQSQQANSGIFFRTNVGNGTIGTNPDPTLDVMTLRSNGRVGIGTTNPDGLLHVNMPAGRPPIFEFNSASSLGSAGVELRTSRNTAGTLEAVQSNDLVGSYGFSTRDTNDYEVSARIVARAAENHTNTAHGTHIDFESADTGSTSVLHKMRIGSNGMVGIGTATPTEKLHLEGSGTQRILIRETSNGVRTKMVSAVPPDAPTPRGYVGTESNHPTTLGANDLDMIWILQNGNIGVGTQTPQVKLDVAGTIRPNSAGVTTGAVCTQEGAFAYDFTNHQPVFCSQGGLWTSMGAGGGVLPGTMCGQHDAGSFGFQCQGHNPNISCPSGYTRTDVWGGIYSCVKN